jgi:flagellar biosynthesis regulator FlaF
MIAMSNTADALQAYRAAKRFRSQRDQEAEVFRIATAALKAARNGTSIQQVRALADNRRLWITVTDLMCDQANALPAPLRASIMSVGLTVQREMDQDAPNFDFLISINENIAAGLAGQP